MGYYDGSGRWVEDGDPLTGREYYQDSRPDWSAGVDQQLADIPLLGGITGAAGRRDAEAARRAEVENRNIWRDLLGSAPTADDLAVEYQTGDYVEGPGRSELGAAGADPASLLAQRRALERLEELSRGGLSDADRAQMRLGRERADMAARSQRDAALQGLEARGLGGSGMSLLARQTAAQGAGMAGAASDASLLAASQQRALQALQGYGTLASGMRGQSFSEDATRRGAVDDFNRWATERRQAHSYRGADMANRSSESRSDARDTAYRYRERAAGGMTGQYAGDQSRRQAEAARRDRQDEQTAGFIGGLIDTFSS